ncbi:MAG: alanine racemase [Hyphomicrobiales bacterium]|nr:alanine racemase [Hyphomicrobiales bacterium]
MVTYNVGEHLASCKLTIDHAALCDNWRKLDAASPGARTASVVKANGYGLGLGEVGISLAAAGCEVFFVANVDEGIRLRRILKTREIFVFSGLTRRNAAAFAESNLVPVLNSIEDISVWAEFWKLRGSRRPCAVQLDTGMNRMGLNSTDIAKYANNDDLASSINIITVLSHLACADDRDHEMNKLQLERFQLFSEHFKGSEFSLANSAGIYLGNSYHFNLVRPGIALYGGEYSKTDENEMSVVVSAEARIAQIQNVKKGEMIGYGGTHVFTRDSKVATVSAGYADGYLRSGSSSTSGGAIGAIGKTKVPVVGCISMDYTTFDVSDIPEQVLENTETIELFGHHVKLDDAARRAGTLGYEFLTSIGRRYYRNHVNQPEHSPGQGISSQ